MTAKIDKISIDGFRGATVPVELEFDISKAVVLVFGENGTGKSTVADAFDFVCNGKYGSIGDYSLAGSAHKFVPALGRGAADVKVGLCSGSQTWEASLRSDGSVVRSALGFPHAEILRRKAIVRLIDQTPSKRFEELRSFVALPGVEKSENALRDAAKQTSKAFDDAVKALLQAQDAMGTLWLNAGKPGTSALAWAQAEAKKDISLLELAVKFIDELESSFKVSAEALSNLDAARTVEDLAKQKFEAADQIVKAVEAGKQDAALIRLLQEARSYLASRETLSECPVCERDGIVGADLAQKLSDRISLMKRLAEAVEVRKGAQADWNNKKAVAQSGAQVYCGRIRTLARQMRPSTVNELKGLGNTWTEFEALIDLDEAKAEYEEPARSLWSKLTPIRGPLMARRDLDRKTVALFADVKSHLKTVSEKETQSKFLETLKGRLDAALIIVSEERKGYVDETLTAIHSDVDAMYERLHPDEGIGKLRLFLKANAIGSLELDANFQGVPHVPPQAYYSESHLDTLGTCVFLALAKLFKADIVVLDDVMTSIDAPHLTRFMSLLHEEAKHFNQVIVTTHYRPWRDQYRWAKGATANTDVIELGPWTLTDGLNIGSFTTAFEELRTIVAKPLSDRQAAASKAGIVLESLLDFLTLRYRCKLSRNAQNEYTLGELAGGITSKLAGALKSRRSKAKGAPKVETGLGPMLDKATSATWVRNSVGCHFSKLGGEVADADVVTFCKSVVNLAMELVCSACGTLPLKRPSGSFWQCQCGDLELDPLVSPGADLKTVDDES